MAGDAWLKPGTCGVKLREFEAISRRMCRFREPVSNRKLATCGVPDDEQ